MREFQKVSVSKAWTVQFPILEKMSEGEEGLRACLLPKGTDPTRKHSGLTGIFSGLCSFFFFFLSILLSITRKREARLRGIVFP